MSRNVGNQPWKTCRWKKYPRRIENRKMNSFFQNQFNCSRKKIDVRKAFKVIRFIRTI